MRQLFSFCQQASLFSNPPVGGMQKAGVWYPVQPGFPIKKKKRKKREGRNSGIKGKE
jgi:hypothetical protein